MQHFKFVNWRIRFLMSRTGIINSGVCAMQAIRMTQIWFGSKSRSPRNKYMNRDGSLFLDRDSIILKQVFWNGCKVSPPEFCPPKSSKYSVSDEGQVIFFYPLVISSLGFTLIQSSNYTKTITEAVDVNAN